MTQTAENHVFSFKAMDKKLDRSLSLKRLELGYFRVCPLKGLDMVYDLSVYYSRFYKMKVSENRNRFEVLGRVIARAHAGFGESYVRKVGVGQSLERV